MVALSYLNLNPVTYSVGQGQEEEPASSSRYAAPPGSRRARITHEVRAKVVAGYQSGESTRQVAMGCGIAKATVLAILKSEDVEIRPRGRRY